MKTSLLFFVLFSFLVFSFSVGDVYGFGQVAGKIIVDIKPGESSTFDWGLFSDKSSAVTNVMLSADGQGSEFLSFDDEVLPILPKDTIFTTITVNIPDDYPGDIELTPRLFATEFGEK